MRERVLAAARRAGRDPEEITCVYNVEVRVDERARAAPSVVAGPPDEVAGRLTEFLRSGFDALNLIPSGPGHDEQAERLAVDVLPAVRAG